MPKTSAVLARMREICLALPDTKETLTWGTPHFRVGEKIFSGCGEEDGRAVISFKLEMGHAKAIVHDPRFRPAPYVGHKGWVSMDVSPTADWDLVRELVQESYRLIAPKRSLAKLPAEPAPVTRAAKAKIPKERTTAAKRASR